MNAAIALSGLAGLVYEVVWARYLALLGGSTAWAQASVMACFLGGMALGSARLGAAAQRSAAPLRVFAFLELGTALWGGLAPVLFSVLDARASRLLAAVPALGAAAAGALLVAPAAFLMGGTLPALVQALSRREAWERDLSRLYAFNCSGAALGALAASFVLIPRLGLDLTALAAAMINASIGAYALLLARPPSTKAPSPTVATSVLPSRPRAAALHFSAFLSGASALTLEAAWIRLLCMVLGSSTYSLSIMLASFIAGIAAGGFAVSRLGLGRRDPTRAYAALQWGAAACVLASLPLWHALPYAFLRFGAWIPRRPEYYLLYEAGKLLFALAAMGPTAFCLGAALPLACRAAARGDERGAAAGRVFAFNTAGNVLGAFLGPALMPTLGLKGLLLGGAALNAVAAAWASPRSLGRRWLLPAAASLALGAAGAALWDPALLSYGVFRHREGAPPSLAELRRALKAQDLLYYRDDREATVTVVRDSGGTLFLKVNGKTDASSGADMATQRLVAHFPLAHAPGARKALLVGLASGATASAALAHPIERLDVVEISPAMAEVAPLFEPWTGPVLGDPRLALHIGDAKAFLRARPGPWDVIISEPSNPWIAGVGNLFTLQFYEAARDRLAPGGIVAQWFHIYEMDSRGLRMVLRTFCRAFEDVSVWQAGPGDIVLLGRARDGRPAPRLEEAFSLPRVRDGMGASGIRDASGLRSLRLLDDAAARELAGPGPLNEDRFPRLEFEAPRAFFLDRATDLLAVRRSPER